MIEGEGEEDEENIFEEMRNFTESENHSIGPSNRIIVVQENLVDPFENNDSVLSLEDGGEGIGGALGQQHMDMWS